MTETKTEENKDCDDDVFSLKDLKLNFIPSEKNLVKFDKFFKYLYWAWYAFMVYTAVFMSLDFRAHPELYHYVEGISGEELVAEEGKFVHSAEVASEFFLLETPLADTNFDDFPDWVYVTGKDKAYVHLAELVMGRVGMFFMATFFMFGLKLRIVQWKLHYARKKLLEVKCGTSV